MSKHKEKKTSQNNRSYKAITLNKLIRNNQQLGS